MKALIIYDSNYGNTKLVAEEIAKNLGDDIKITSVKQIDKSQIKNFDLLLLGSPINGWRPTESFLAFLKDIEQMNLKGIKFATFDTRIKSFFHGDAKDKMAKALESTGAEMITEPKAFYVAGTEGPLFDGELKNASDWAKKIKTLV